MINADKYTDSMFKIKKTFQIVQVSLNIIYITYLIIIKKQFLYSFIDILITF